MPGHLNHCVVPLTTSTVKNLGTLVAAALPAISPTTTVLNCYVQPLAANVAVVYIGGSTSLSSSDFGARLEIPVSSVPQAPFLLPGGDRAGAAINLDDVYLLGATNDKVAVFWHQSL